MNTRALRQSQVAVYTGVGQAAISDVLNKEHVPRVETLFRLAGFWRLPRARAPRRRLSDCAVPGIWAGPLPEPGER